MKNLNRVITPILGFFMLIPGFAKFTEHFHSNFTKQIEFAELPFRDLTFFMGQAGLLTTGFILYITLLFWKKLSSPIATKLFYLGNLMVIPIMSVAFYVHMHPNVPAEILPMEVKPPFLSVILIALALINIYVFHKAATK